VSDGEPRHKDGEHGESATPAPIRAMRVIALSRESRPHTPIAAPVAPSVPPFVSPPTEAELVASELAVALAGSESGEAGGTPLPTFADRPTPDWHDVRTAEKPPPVVDPEELPSEPGSAHSLPSFADELAEELTPVFVTRPNVEGGRASSLPPERPSNDPGPPRNEPIALRGEPIEELHDEILADELETPLMQGAADAAFAHAPSAPVTHEAVTHEAHVPVDDSEFEHDFVDVDPSPISAPEVHAAAAFVDRSAVKLPSKPNASDPPQADGDGQRGALPAAADRPPPPKRASSGRPALPTAKVRKKPWWEEVFGDDFSRAYRAPTGPQVSREADFILGSFGLSPGAVVLDLGCGQGEYAVEIGRRGYSVVGYDLSVFQLAMAADRAQAANQRINFLQGDMREMAFDGMFDGVLSWNTSFGYFEDEKNFEVLCRIQRALKPGGVLMLEVLNRDYAARETPISNWYEGDGCICMDDMTLDFITSRLTVKRSVILDDGRSKEVTYSVRLYCLSEIGKMLHDAGFAVQTVSGSPSTPGAFLGGSSPSLIIRAERVRE